MEEIQIESNQKKQRRLRFMGVQPLFFVLLAIYAALIIYVACSWKLFYDVKKELWWLNLVYAGLFLLGIGFFFFFRFRAHKSKGVLLNHLLLTVLAAFFSYYQIEMLGFNDIIKEEVQAVFINWGLILLIYLLGYVLTNRFRGAVIFGNTLCFVLAVTNHLVFLFRGTPLLPNDIYATQTAMSVLGQMKYEVSYQTILGVLPWVLNYAIAGNMTYKNQSWKAHLIAKIGGTVVITAVMLLCICTDALLYCGTSISYWNTVKSCNANGEVMQFMIYIRKSQVEKPEEYSLQRIEEIENQYASLGEQGEQPVSEENPNVIVIMNEAFSDLSVIQSFETNEDYLPFFRSLTENTIKGQMVASIKGGGTCNTEFEFLTSSSQAFLPASCLPYQQYIHSDMPSMASIMKGQGYQVLAIHPYYATGWRRSTVYPLLGFDEFHSLEDFPSYAQKGRLRLITDYANYQYLIERFEEKEADAPIFIFNVTMQNHSGYSSDYNFTERITLNDYDSEEYLNAEVYLSLMRQSDSAFKYLIEYFKKVDEPTIVVMFGDHQPGDMNAFLDALSADLSDSLEDLSKLYAVPYIIWANYEIEEKDIEYISANYLSSVVMEMAGIQLPAYNSFLLQLREEFPVISSKICIDRLGNYMSPTEALTRGEMVREYQLLQYNNLFDSKNRNELFFYGYETSQEQ